MTDTDQVWRLVAALEASNRRLEEAVALLEHYAAIAEERLSHNAGQVSYLFPERLELHSRKAH